jgi:signal transduction histidine kinase
VNRNDRLRDALLGPLSWAGYLTWSAVALEHWTASGGWAPVAGVSARLLAVGLLLAFLAAFVLRAPREGDRRTWPDAALLVMTAIPLALMLLGRSGTAPVLFIIVAGAAVASLVPAAVIGLLGTANAAFVAILVLVWREGNPVLFVAIYGGFQLFAAFTLLERERARGIAAQLRSVNAELLATRSLLAESARDGERLRVSRELHDVTGHKLTALALNLELLGQEPDVAARREYGIARRLATELLSDVRQVVSRLRRDDGLDLREALARVAEPFPRPRVHLEVAPDARAPDTERAETLVRVVQEALTNAARHSGAANVWVSLAPSGPELRLEIEDDGACPAVLRPGNGLAGLRERVEEGGGRFDVARGERGGVRLVATLPQAAVP